MKKLSRKKQVVIGISAIIAFLASLFGFLADGFSIYDRFLNNNEIELNDKASINKNTIGHNSTGLVFIASNLNNSEDFVKMCERLSDSYYDNSTLSYYIMNQNYQDKFLFFYEVKNSSYLDNAKLSRNLGKEAKLYAKLDESWCLENLLHSIYRVYKRDISNKKLNIDIFIFADLALCNLNEDTFEKSINEFTNTNLYFIQSNYTNVNHHSVFDKFTLENDKLKKVFYTVDLPVNFQ